MKKAAHPFQHFQWPIWILLDNLLFSSWESSWWRLFNWWRLLYYQWNATPACSPQHLFRLKEFTTCLSSFSYSFEKNPCIFQLILWRTSFWFSTASEMQLSLLFKNMECLCLIVCSACWRHKMWTTTRKFIYASQSSLHTCFVRVSSPDFTLSCSWLLSNAHLVNQKAHHHFDRRFNMGNK